jgi:hypothetical protein
VTEHLSPQGRPDLGEYSVVSGVQTKFELLLLKHTKFELPLLKHLTLKIVKKD